MWSPALSVSVLENQKLSFLLLYSELVQNQGTDSQNHNSKVVIANLFAVRNLTSGQLKGLCQLLIANFSIWQGFQKVALRPWMARMVRLKQLRNPTV